MLSPLHHDPAPLKIFGVGVQLSSPNPDPISDRNIPGPFFRLSLKNKFLPIFRHGFLESIPVFRPKWLKSIPYFRLNWLKNHIPFGASYTHIACIGLPSNKHPPHPHPTKGISVLAQHEVRGASVVFQNWF